MFFVFLDNIRFGAIGYLASLWQGCTRAPFIEHTQQIQYTYEIDFIVYSCKFIFVARSLYIWVRLEVFINMEMNSAF